MYSKIFLHQPQIENNGEVKASTEFWKQKEVYNLVRYFLYISQYISFTHNKYNLNIFNRNHEVAVCYYQVYSVFDFIVLRIGWLGAKVPHYLALASIC